MVATKTVAAALLLAFVACALAQQSDLSLLDITRGTEGSTVRPSSYGGYSVVHSCLQQTQDKSCRVTGGYSSRVSSSCPYYLEDADGGYEETDMSCCGKHNDYGYGTHEALGQTTIQGKAATCKWWFNVLKEYTPGVDTRPFFLPVQETDTTPYVNIGPAHAICQFTEEADRCEGPYCSDMTITMTGNLWATLAYSREPGNYLSSTSSSSKSGDNCKKRNTYLNSMQNDFAPGTAPITLLEGADGVVEPEQKSCPSDLPQEGQPYKDLWQDIVASLGKTTLKTIYEASVSQYRGSTSEEKGVYAGLAFVYSGETSISSLKSNLKVEETGHMEHTFYFWAWDSKIPSIAQWPTVRGGAMKLWFKEEEEKGHPGHRY